MAKSKFLALFGMLCIYCYLLPFLFGCVRGDPTVHLDFFHKGDSNNDTSLSMSECKSMWKSLDIDHDATLDKVEFLLQWTFHNFQDPPHAPLFFHLMDSDFDGRISEGEMGKTCSFFDDDEDGLISSFEFDLNWKGLFTT